MSGKKSLPAAMLADGGGALDRTLRGITDRAVTETSKLVMQDVPANTFVSFVLAIYGLAHTGVLANADILPHCTS